MDTKQRNFLIEFLAVTAISLCAVLFINYFVYMGCVYDSATKKIIDTAEKTAGDISVIFDDDGASQEYLIKTVDETYEIDLINVFRPDNTMLYSSSSISKIGLFYGEPLPGELNETPTVVDDEGDTGVTAMIFKGSDYVGYSFFKMDKNVMAEAKTRYIEKSGTAFLAVAAATAAALAIWILASGILEERKAGKCVFFMTCIVPTASVMTAGGLITSRVYDGSTASDMPENALKAVLVTALFAAAAYIIFVRLYTYYANKKADFKDDDKLWDGRTKYNKDKVVIWSFFFLLLSQIDTFEIIGKSAALFAFSDRFVGEIARGGTYGIFALGLILGGWFFPRLNRDAPFFAGMKIACMLGVISSGIMLMESIPAFVIGNGVRGFAVGLGFSAVFSIVYRVRDEDRKKSISLEVISSCLAGVCVGIVLSGLFAEMSITRITIFLGAAGMVVMYLLAGRGMMSIYEVYGDYNVFEKNAAGFNSAEVWKFMISVVPSGIYRTVLFYTILYECGDLGLGYRGAGWAVMLYIIGFTAATAALRRCIRIKTEAGAILPTVFAGAMFIFYSFMPSTPALVLVGLIIGISDGLAIVFHRDYMVDIAKQREVKEVIALKFLASGYLVSFAIGPVVLAATMRMGMANEIGVIGICFAITVISYVILMSDRLNASSRITEKNQSIE